MTLVQPVSATNVKFLNLLTHLQMFIFNGRGYKQKHFILIIILLTEIDS